MKHIKIFEEFNQLPGESLYDTFIRLGKDPNKFGIENPKTKNKNIKSEPKVKPMVKKYGKIKGKESREDVLKRLKLEPEKHIPVKLNLEPNEEPNEEPIIHQDPDEYLYNTFIRHGKNPSKFGVNKPEGVTGKMFPLEKIKVNDRLNNFILYMYDNFENLLSEYNTTTMSIFLISLIGYINNGKISRRKIYEFVNTFDIEDKIRKYTFNIYDYEVNYEDWHHIGGALSHLMTTLCEMTESTENNGVDSKYGFIFKVPNSLIRYINDVLDIFESDGIIMLDNSYSKLSENNSVLKYHQYINKN